MLEGFPRSGNTFAFAAFCLAQGRPVCVGRHLHVAAQLKLGLRLGLPVVLMVREPESAVISYVIRESYLDLNFALWEYVRFHRGIIPFAQDILVVRFEEVTTNFGWVIDAVNQRFGRCYKSFQHTAENLASVFERIEDLDRLDSGSADVREAAVPRPSKLRAAAAELYAERLRKPELSQRLLAARTVYREILEFAVLPEDMQQGVLGNA